MQMVNLRVSFIVIDAFLILDEVLHLQYLQYSTAHHTASVMVITYMAVLRVIVTLVPKVLSP